MVGIYKITNPKGRIYIGQSVNIENRWNYYKGYHSKSQPKLYNSFKKYGWEKHKFEIIEECSIEELDEKEFEHKSKILKEGNWKKCLFCRLKDYGRGPLTEQHKKDISNSRYNPIYQYDLDGNFIKEWYNMRVASKALNLSNGYLHTVLNSKTKTIGGFQFKKYKKKKIPSTYRWKNVGKEVIQYDKNMNEIRRFDSAKKAAEFIGAHVQNVSACCKNQNKTCKGFIFKYK